jgi:3D (Asp-Asp-Asp) domain-containing protein
VAAPVQPSLRKAGVAFLASAPPSLYRPRVGLDRPQRPLLARPATDLPRWSFTRRYALRGRTATGIPAGRGVVAVDPAVIPLGTRLTIPGYGKGIAADIGSSVRGRRIDIWFPSRARALAWGERTVTVTLH